MIESLVLLERNNVKEEELFISLGNAKQLVIGNVPGLGVVIHVAADSQEYLRNALIDFSKVPNVTGVVILILRSSL